MKLEKILVCDLLDTVLIPTGWTIRVSLAHNLAVRFTASSKEECFTKLELRAWQLMNVYRFRIDNIHGVLDIFIEKW